MLCDNCGSLIGDGSKICPKCGKILETQENVTEVTNQVLDPDPDQKNNSPKSIVIVTVILIAIVIIGISKSGWFKSYIIRSNPVNWSLYGLSNIANAKSVNSYTDITFKYNAKNLTGSDLILKEGIEDLTLRLDTNSNKSSNQIEINAAIMFKNENNVILRFQIYLDKDAIYVSIPLFYDKTIKLTYKDLYKLIDSTGNDTSIDYKKYSSVFYLNDSKYSNIIGKDYINFLKLNLPKYYTNVGKSTIIMEDGSSNKSYDCTGLVLNMNSSTFECLLNSYLNKVSQDKNVKNLIKDKLSEFFVIAEKNKELSRFNLNKEDTDTYIKNYDKIWDSSTKNMKLTENNKSSINSINPKLSYSLEFDLKNVIRQATLKVNFNTNSNSGSLGKDNFNINVTADTYYRSLNETKLIEKPSPSNVIDYANLSDENENNIINGIQSQFSEQFGIN